jgi:DNA-binding transcriptional LysR family regulator
MLNHYRTFLCVVEQETLSKAAEVLHLTQPTITRQIQQLERETGVLLFDRVGKRLMLTRAGERVRDYASQLLMTETRMYDELNQLTDPERGVVLIGAGLTPTIYRLPSVIARYRRLHPGVRFQVITGSSKQTVTRLLERVIDVGLVTTAPAHMAELASIPLWRDDLLLVASPQYALPSSPLNRTELAQLPMVLMRSESGLRQIVEQQLVPNERLNMVLETDSLEAISRFVQTGLGVAVLPKSVVQDDILAERLVQLSLTDVTLGYRTITAVVRTSSSMSAATKAFADALPQLAREAELEELS